MLQFFSLQSRWKRSPSSIHDAVSCFLLLLPGVRWAQPCRENMAGRLFWGLLSTQVCRSGWRQSLSPRSFWAAAGVWLGTAEGEVGNTTWSCSWKEKGPMWKTAGELGVAQRAVPTETSLRLRSACWAEPGSERGRTFWKKGCKLQADKD